MAVVVRVDIAPDATTTVDIRPAVDGQAPHGTPHAWLAQHGLATNETGELYDEGDGVPAWQEYVADTDPTSTASCFRIRGATNQPPLAIWFDSSTNRRYALFACSNLVNGAWTRVEEVAERPGVGGPDSIQVPNPLPGQTFRPSVVLP